MEEMKNYGLIFTTLHVSYTFVVKGWQKMPPLQFCSGKHES